MPATVPPPPTDAELRAELGDAHRLWTEVIASAPAVPTWKYYGAKLGYGLKMLEKKRNLFFMSVREGRIVVGFIFGEKAVDQALASDLDENLKEMLRAAARYPEGRGVRLAVESPGDVETVRRLLEIKRAS